MGPRISWIIMGLTFLVSQNVFCKKVHLSHKKGVTANPGKKTTIGDFDLKKHPIQPKDCKDIKENCHRLLDRLPNVCSLNSKYMMDKCRLTCRFCSQYKEEEITECEDLNPKCRSWSETRDCIHYSGFMKTNCKKSCKLCGPENDFTDKDEKCPEWAKIGMCKLNKKKVSGFCPYSCRKYKNREYHSPEVLPVPIHDGNATHTITAHKRRPTPPPTRPPPKKSEEEKEDDEEAQKEWLEEQINREEEKAEQEREKLDVKMRPDDRSPTPPPDMQPAPVPAPLTQPAPVPAPEVVPFPQEEDDDPSNEVEEPDDTETGDDTNEQPGVRVKKRKDKSKLLILIGETKRHLKKKQNN